ncbi:thioesterase family protein [soil metagenome]
MTNPSPSVTAVAPVELRVRYAETDQMGVVYHANYLIWCELGRTDLMRQLGASYAELERRGVYLAVSDAALRYHAPARYDDRIRVRTEVERVRSRGVTFGYLIARAAEDEGEARLVSATTTLIARDAQGRGRSLPADLVATLRAGLAE